MDWRDEGVLLSMRLHGEGSAIIEVFTAAHGRHYGVVRGGASRRLAPVLQPGSQVAVVWRARLDEQIGAFVVEPMRSRAAVLQDPLALAGLTSACALLRLALPERAPHGAIYASSINMLDAITSGTDWLGDYLRWELLVLEEIGFGLDLSRCAVTGAREDLAFVSPRTGRAISRGAAGEWAPKLLPLPQAMLGQGPVSHAEALQALAITGHFLGRELAGASRTGTLPEARSRLLSRLARLG
ncbi:MAG: DNA repair protein RecO [Rhodobacteraceae bacterium]|nr:DNA repair protein RecO [Paracoccaceae bacterium]